MVLKKPCRQPLCSSLADKGSSYCAKHKPAESRGEHKYNHMYASVRWRKLRRAVLLEQVTCAECGSEANEVDHIIAHRGDYNLFYDTSNLQALCKSCHSKKTVQEIASRRN